jgi:hypothetical protein
MTRTQRKLILVLEHIELKKVNHLFSQLLELLKRESVKTYLSIKNIFQLMEMHFSTKELDKFFLDGIIKMFQAEESFLVKLFQEQVLLELSEISLENTDQLQFTFQVQHGETITQFSRLLDLMLEHIDISIRKQEDSISKVCFKIFKMLLQDHAFCYTHVPTTQQVLIQLSTNGKEFTKLFKLDNFTHSLIPLIKDSFQETSMKTEKD